MAWMCSSSGREQGQDPPEASSAAPEVSPGFLSQCWASWVPYLVFQVLVQCWAALSCFWTHPAWGQGTLRQIAVLCGSSWTAARSQMPLRLYSRRAQCCLLATTSNGIQACFVLNQCRHTVLSCDCLEEKLGSYSQLVCWFNAWCQANNLIPLFPFTPCVWGLIILKIMWWKLLLCFEPCSKNHRNRKGRRKTVWDLNLILLPWICLLIRF